MANLIKKIFNFGKKKLTDEEIYDVWKMSNKTLTDFLNLITATSEGKRKFTIVQEMDKVIIKNSNEMTQLINFLKGFITKVKTIKSNKQADSDVVIDTFITNCEFCLNLFKIISNNGSNYSKYLFNNRFENLRIIINDKSLYNSLNSAQRESLLDFLYSTYFTHENYIQSLEYALLKEKSENNLLQFLLPNDNNLHYIENNNCIVLLKDFDNIFKRTNKLDFSDADYKIEKNLLNYQLNLLLHFAKGRYNKKENNLRIIENVKQTSEQNYLKLKTLNEFYSFYVDIFNLTKKFTKEKLRSFYDFVNENIEEIFNSHMLSLLGKFSLETFEGTTKKMLDTHTKLEKIFQGKEFEYFPIMVLYSFLKEKVPIKIISSYLNSIHTYYQEDIQKHNLMTNLLLKYLVENYTDTIQNNLFVFEALEYNKKILPVEELITDISKMIKFLGIMEKVKIQVNMIDILQDEHKQMKSKLEFKNSFIFKIVIEYLTKLCNNFRKTTDHKFIDNNLDNITVLNDYLKKFDQSLLSNVLPDLLNNFKTHTIPVLLENDYMKKNISENEMEVYLTLIIENKDKDNEIDDYLSDIQKFLKNSDYKTKIKRAFEHKLTNLARYFEIKKVFQDNQISPDILKEYDYEHLNLNLNKILEIFIFQKFNVNQIENLDTFLQRTEDIYKALDFDKFEYLFVLFGIFLKYQNEKIYISILKFFTDDEIRFVYFEKCLNLLKKSNVNLSDFLNENNFKTKLIENTQNYNIFENQSEFLERIDFNKDKITIKFNLENEEIFTLINLQGEKSNYHNLLNNDNENIKTNFLNFIKNVSTSSKKDVESPPKKTLKYSLHPKLKFLLDQINFDYKGKEFQFNTKLSFKCSLYKLLLRKKVINSIEEILELENIDLAFKSHEETQKVVLLLMNLYESRISDLFNNFFKMEDILNQKLLYELISFNLQNVKYFNLYHFEFLNNINNLTENKILKLKDNTYALLSIVNKLTRNKFNILPFLTEESFSLLNRDSSFNENLKNYYNEYSSNINYFKENLFMGEKSKTFISNNISHFQTKLQMIEVYKHVNMNNFMNFQRAFPLLLNTDLEVHNNLNFLFYLKLFVNLPNLSSLHPSYCRSVKEIIQVIKTFKISNDELKCLVSELFFLPNIPFILESQSNILLLDKNVGHMLRDLILAKILIFEALQIDPQFNQILSKSYMILDKFKIFKMKNYVLQNVPKTEAEIKNIYEGIQHLADYHRLKQFVDKNEKMKKDLERIYTSESF